MVNKVDVYKEFVKVGTLALTSKNKVAFQYSEEWLRKGFSINPFKLPLNDKVFLCDTPYFRGNFGVFADSLPDAFGELVLDRYLRSKGIDSSNLNPLERLCYIGKSGMGAFDYVPSLTETKLISGFDFDEMQKECNSLLDSKEVKDIDSLYSFAGSSGGARPKSLIVYNGEDYIAKFSSRFDQKNITEMEFNCMSLAKKAGINIPDIQLISTKSGNSYYLIKRFDRNNHKRVHMISAAALLENDFRSPCLDYNDLIKLTRVLTNNDTDVLEMYRRMVFNVLIGNQDDHAKNFAYLYDETDRCYRLSPAYDITPSKTYYQEHTTSVNGKGKDISESDMLEIAKKNRIDLRKAKEIISFIKDLLNENTII